MLLPNHRLERTGRQRPENASPLAAGPLKLDVGSWRWKAREFSLWSRQSASASREAAVFDGASGGSVTGADGRQVRGPTTYITNELSS